MNIGAPVEATFIVPLEEPVEATTTPVPITAPVDPEETLTAVG